MQLLIFNIIYIILHASRGGSTLRFDQWRKVVSTRPHFTHGEAHTGKGSKVHNGGGPYPRPDLRISRSLHHEEARSGHEFQCP
jgi:hypothetical protein